MERQDIIFGVTGQSWIYDAPEGRPTSVTSVTVYRASTDDDGTAEVATTGVAAVETNPNTTLDATSGAGQADPRRIALTATTGCTVGRRYRITSAAGRAEDVEVMEVAAADSVRVRHPLIGTYAAADTFASTRISIGVDSTWVAERNHLSHGAAQPYYRLRWVYVVGGVTYVHYSDGDLVRYPAAEHGVTAVDIERLVPGWIDALPTQHRPDQGRALIDEGYRGVKVDLYQVGIGDEAVRDRDAMRELVQRKTVVLWTEARAYLTGELAGVEVARTAYRSVLEQTVRIVTRVPVAGEGGAGRARVTAGIWG